MDNECWELVNELTDKILISDNIKALVVCDKLISRLNLVEEMKQDEMVKKKV